MPPSTPQAYTRDQLLAACSSDVTPRRCVRKAIFSCQLWLPSSQRVLQRHRLHRWRAPFFPFGPLEQPVTVPKPAKPLLTSISFASLNAQSVGNKFPQIAGIITESDIDVFLLSETWHSTSDDVAIRRSTPSATHVSMCHVPRPIRPRTTAVSLLSSPTA